jgi:hypothetical protein
MSWSPLNSSKPARTPPPRRWAVAAGIAATGGCLLALHLGQDQQAPPAPPQPVLADTAREPGPRPAAGAHAPAARSVPQRVILPTIDVDSRLEELGLDADRQLVPPADPDRAGWYRNSPTPGELGPAVVAGHVDSTAGPAVFHRLGALRPGDPVRVVRADGRVAVFRVDRVAAYDKDAFPTRDVYGDLPYAGLRLITCGGSYDSDNGGYQANVVVFASLTRLV